MTLHLYPLNLIDWTSARHSSLRAVKKVSAHLLVFYMNAFGGMTNTNLFTVLLAEILDRPKEKACEATNLLQSYTYYMYSEYFLLKMEGKACL